MAAHKLVEPSLISFYETPGVVCDALEGTGIMPPRLTQRWLCRCSEAQYRIQSGVVQGVRALATPSVLAPLFESRVTIDENKRIDWKRSYGFALLPGLVRWSPKYFSLR